MPSCGTDCSGAPFLPILYVAFNLLFNISALSVLRTGGEPQDPVPKTGTVYSPGVRCRV